MIAPATLLDCTPATFCMGDVMTATARLLGLAVGLLILARDLWWLYVFGYAVFPDSLGYLGTDVLRTPVYPTLALAVGAEAAPVRLILLQIALSATAAGLLVYALARSSLVAATLAGALFVLDTTWAMLDRWMLTEAVVVALGVGTLAAALLLVERRRPWWVYGAFGALAALACAVRPTNLLLLGPILGLVLLFSWSLRGTLVAAGGVAVVLALLTGVIWAQTGQARLFGGTGVYVAFPLFSRDLFEAGNGPDSAALDRAGWTCGLDFSVGASTPDAANLIVHHMMLPCLKGLEWDDERISSTVSGAYREAILASPERYAALMVEQAGSMLVWPASMIGVGSYGLNSGGYPTICRTEAGALGICAGPSPGWDAARRSSAIGDIRAVVDRVEHVGLAHLGLADLYSRTLADRLWYGLDEARSNPLGYWRLGGHVVLWSTLAVVGLCLLSPVREIRLVGLWASAVCGLTILSVVTGAVVIPRYAAVLTPWWALLSACALGSVLTSIGWSFGWLVCSVTGHRPSVTRHEGWRIRGETGPAIRTETCVRCCAVLDVRSEAIG